MTVAGPVIPRTSTTPTRCRRRPATRRSITTVSIPRTDSDRNLLVSELRCDDGCWSGYPAHKHDTDALPEETCHEEVYHYRFNPENGFRSEPAGERASLR